MNGYGLAKIFLHLQEYEVQFSHLRKIGHAKVYVGDSTHTCKGDTYQTSSECSWFHYYFNRTRICDKCRKINFNLKTYNSFTGICYFIRKHGLNINWWKTEIKILSSSILHTTNESLWELASLVDTIVVSFPAVTYGPLHYRHFEKEGWNI